MESYFSFNEVFKGCGPLHAMNLHFDFLTPSVPINVFKYMSSQFKLSKYGSSHAHLENKRNSTIEQKDIALSFVKYQCLS